MPAGGTNATMTLDAVVAVAAAYTGVVACDKGYRRFQDVENWETTVSAYTPGSQSYCGFWLKELTVAENQAFPARIIGFCTMAIAKDVNSDLNAYWDYVIGLANNIAKDANYGIGASKPSSVKVSLYSIDVLKTPGLIHFDFGAFGNGGIEFPDP